jgi:hypothetical protein
LVIPNPKPFRVYELNPNFSHNPSAKQLIAKPYSAVQVANYIEFGPEDSDEDKKRALAEVVGVGESCWAKVSNHPVCNPVTLGSFSQVPPFYPQSKKHMWGMAVWGVLYKYSVHKYSKVPFPGENTSTCTFWSHFTCQIDLPLCAMHHWPSLEKSYTSLAFISPYFFWISNKWKDT